jgi:glycosyltransferase involved in cell wall biosynthesis
MKIVYLMPGSGDRFYCENCVRDVALARALRAAGHEVRVAPLYLPPFADPIDGIPSGPIFYGGINAYLQQRFAFFRKTPGWVDRLFDARPLLRLAARSAGSVRAAELGEMTLSVLLGEEGRQRKELERLLRWIETQERPEAVHLSSPLLAGIGAAVRRRFGLPVVCTMQDEDVWVDAMDEPYRTRCWEAMARMGREVDAFVAVSRYFAEAMRGRLGIPPERLHVVYPGIEAGAEPAAAGSGPPAIGYLARLCASMGLEILAEAFLRLRRSGAFGDVRLHLAGGMTADDEEFVDGLLKRFAEAGLDGAVRIFSGLEPARRREFLESVRVLSVPAPSGAAFGTFLLEALAAGVPVVQPRLGAFPELVEATGGGILYEPNDAEALARALGKLLSDERQRLELGRRGRESVVKNFGLDRMAREMLAVYGKAVASHAAR